MIIYEGLHQGLYTYWSLLNYYHFKLQDPAMTISQQIYVVSIYSSKEERGKEETVRSGTWNPFKKQTNGHNCHPK